MSGRNTHRILEEFRASAIPDILTIANVEWIEGEAAIAALTETAIEQLGGHAQQYVTKPVQRLLERYEFAHAGGWIAYGCTLDGDVGAVPYFKPITPRNKTELDFSGPRLQPVAGFGDRHAAQDEQGRPKKVKYETPQGCPGLPLLAWVPDEIATLTWQRHGTTPEPTETYWQNVQRLGLPVVIVEGLKKALALIAQGIPAIALRGITMWHQKGSRELHDAIAHFITPGRTVFICFDQDGRPKTVAEVRKQALALGSEIEKLGCSVRFLHWDGKTHGKGIDDALAAHDESGRGQWLNGLLENALTLKQYRRFGLMARAFAVLDRLERLSYRIERETQGNYLPELPELQQGAIHVVDAGLGAGKTERIGKDWITGGKRSGYFTIALSPMNSLGQQSSNRWGLPHIHDLPPSEASSLWELARHQGGIAMCPDSLHRLPQWIWERPVLLALDEANQICQGLSGAGTLGDRQSDILKIFTSLAEHAAQTGAIVLSEDGIADRAVRLIHVLSQAQSIRIFRHKRQQQPWDCTLYSGQLSGFRARLLAGIQQGKRILFVTTSQREGKRLERAIANSEFVIELDEADADRTIKVARIDSETNEGGQFDQFFNNPDRWLSQEKLDVLVFTPSAKSGISISEAHFDAVWGYFPSLATDSHWQLLGRYRRPVPRHIYVPPFINAGGDESVMSPRRIRQRYQTVAKGMAGLFELGELLQAQEGEEAEQLARIENAILDYHATQKAVEGAQKAIAYDCLMWRLEQAGHNVTEEKCSLDRQTSDLWQRAQEEIWREEASAIANLEITLVNTEEWAHKKLGGVDSRYVERLRAHKVLWRLEFPGVRFDDTEECYEALCLDYGAMRRGVLLQARAENLGATREIDRTRAQKILSADIKALHRLPKDYAKARLIAQLGVLDLLDGEEYSNSDSRAIAIKQAALHWKDEIRYWLRLSIGEEQTPVEICNKLLRKFGLELHKPDRPGAVRRIKREGSRGDREFIYVIDLSYSPTRARLLEAARRKLSEVGVNDLQNKESINMQIIDTPQEQPRNPPPNERLVRWGRSLSLWIVDAVEGDRAQIRNSLSGARATAFLSELEEAA